MNEKNIRRLLTKKLNDWINSIDSDEIKTVVKNNALITGGALVSLLNGEIPNDYDVYFKTKEAVEIVAHYYADIWNENHDKQVEIRYNAMFDKIECFVSSSGIAVEDNENVIDDTSEPVDENVDDEKPTNDSENKPKYRPRYFTSNAISLSDKIQIVTRFYGEINEIHKNYDFIHCTCSFDFKDEKVTLPEKALISIINKELVYVGSKYPICSIIRTRKYLNRGYTINAGQYVKMCLQVSELDLHDVEVLKDQLTGVDSAYFNGVIEYLEKKCAEDKNFKFDNSYLFEIINKIF